MRRLVLSALFFLLPALWAADNPIAGTWACKSDDGAGGELSWTLVVKEDAGKLAGVMSGEAGEMRLIEPKLEGDTFTFKVFVNDRCTVETKVKVKGNKLDGKFACPEVEGTLKGTKQS